jgi:phosphate transport system permease protein
VSAMPEKTMSMGAVPETAVVRLQRSAFEPRALRSGLLTAGIWAAAVMAAVPLVSVLYMLIVRGGARLGVETLTSLPPAGFEMGGGFGNAILGTLVMVGLGGLLSIPVGVLTAVYLAELGPTSRLSQVARFATKTLTGMPSILAGVFAYAVVVLLTGKYSAPAGGLALAVLMVPTVILTAETAIKGVPKVTRDAAYGMGCTRSQVIWKVLLPTAMPGILTGVMLAVARAAGETAPLLFTALFSNFWLVEGGHLKLLQPTASLAVLIYNFSGMPFENQIELAWAASLVLVLMVLIINVVSRLVGQRRM